MSPPEIKQRRQAFFYFCDTGRRTRKSRCKRRGGEPKAKDPHGVETNMGIYSPCVPTRNSTTACRSFCFALKKIVFYDIIRIFSGRHLVVFFIARHRGCFFMGENYASTKIFTRTDFIARIRR